MLRAKTQFLVQGRFQGPPPLAIHKSQFLKDVWAEINKNQKNQGASFDSKLVFCQARTPPDRGPGRGRGGINPSPCEAINWIRINLGKFG